MGDLIDRQTAIEQLCDLRCGCKPSECDYFGKDGCLDYGTIRLLKSLPSVQPEWNNHTVACLLADLFNDPCACNYNGINEWLLKFCDFADKECPHPVGVACWEQYLKWRGEQK